MDKLIALRKAEQEASYAIMYSKEDEDLIQLHKNQEAARKALREHEKWLYKGSGVHGNEV